MFRYNITNFWYNIVSWLWILLLLIIVKNISILLPNKIEIKELEWYLRDHFFRQSNQGRRQFQKKILGDEIIRLYIRYRNFSHEKMNNMITTVIENLASRHVIANMINSIELTSDLIRLQCSICFYISYLNNNEPRNCLRCLSSELHNFPSKK